MMRRFRRAWDAADSGVEISHRIPASRPGMSIWHILLYLALAAGALYFAIPLQAVKPTQLLIIGFAVGGWLLYSLAFGFSFRATVAFSLLFFLKPLIQTFYALTAMFCFSLAISFYNRKSFSLKLPYPVTFMILAATAVQGLIRARSLADAAPYFFSTLIIPLVLLVYFANNKVTDKDLLQWVKGISLVGAVLGFIGVIMGILNPSERLGSLWITAMTINGFYTVAFFLGLGLVIKAKERREKLFWTIAVLFIFLGMMYTYTRIALVAVLFGVGIMMWRIRRFRGWGIALLCLVPLAIPASMIMRVQASFGMDYSAFVRFLAWYHALRQIALHPLWGIGIATWQKWYIAIVPFDFLYAEHPHNVYLKIMLELGIFGFLAYFYLVWSILRKFYLKCVKGSADNFNFMILLAAIALLFACLTDIFIQQFSVSVAFWSCLAFMHARSREDTKTVPIINEREE
ncbi:MAG TPA: O-antigen ligase family protein [Candidatus Cloacimonadota bacterium]|nr:O-antigen ligase family protein [Candidatus Cloacimonadota bacterium]HPS38805.1 O-antigen ligase family protein [Candidatus Cloacimonadota bacterium]